MDDGPWTFEGEVARTGRDAPAITLVDGADFCLSSGNGDVVGGSPHGLFLLDSRFLSRFELRVEGRPIEGLGASVDSPRAVFFGRVPGSVVVLRRRELHSGLTEELVVRNHGMQPRHIRVELQVDGDFAGLFEVKEGRVAREGWYGQHVDAGTIRLGHRIGERVRETVVDVGRDASVLGGHASWDLRLDPGAEWRTVVTVAARVGDQAVRRGDSAALAPWVGNVPQVEADDPTLVQAVRRASHDLASLRIVDPSHPDLTIVAAGAPWFMSPFGRDSLLTAWMALVVDPDLALGVLQTLARFQGVATNPVTEEQPGRIFHEMRFGEATEGSLSTGRVYYGSVDATPLFVMLLGELRRWGLAAELVDELLPHADRALAWLTTVGDRDSDGYVEYLRGSERGLANQGWKDSWDGIRYGDGRVAEAPIALCEVQGYTYAAYLARAHFAREMDDPATAAEWADRAAALRDAFNRDFWLPDRGWFAVGLDADKRPIDSLASNQGHCLWTGIIDEDKAASVADALLSPQMFSGWGIRTLAADEHAYDPVSYHCGSVWPHDNALIAAGLVRYGHVGHAHRIMRGILDVADANDGRLPELFSGIGRDELTVPAAYPTSCSPQAWAAATPLMFLRLLLRLDPWVPQREVFLAPALPNWLTALRVHGIPIGDTRLDVTVGNGAVESSGLGADLRVVPRPRDPRTSLHQ